MRSRHYIAMGVLAISGIVLAAAITPTTTPDASPSLTAALEQLAGGPPAQAEQTALALARGTDNWNRAWLVVASARQRQGNAAGAGEAYEAFLKSASTEPESIRHYAQTELNRCKATPAKPQQPPSALLSEQDLKDLSKLDPKPSIVSTSHFVVRSRNARLCKLVAAEAEAALARICDAITGQEYPFAVEINVWIDRYDYTCHARSAPEWSGGNSSIVTSDGVTTRRIDLRQLGANGKFDPAILDRVLPHELCHLILRDHFGQASLPLCVNEGLAMMSECAVDDARVALAGTALAGKARIALPDLLRHSQRDGDLPVFYAESYSLIAYLRSHLGQDQFRAMLRHISEGGSLDAAIEQAMYVPHDPQLLASLQQAWESQAVRQTQELETLTAAE